MRLLTRFLLLLTLSAAFSSCKVVKSLRELNRDEPKLYSYRVVDKEVVYCPMHHLGKQVFYDGVSGVVKAHKARGYVVFYELIGTNFTTDSLLKDTIRRKARKLKGFSGTFKENADSKLFEKYMQQPSYPAMGTDANDLRADVDYLQLITEYERRYGAITLDSLDRHTPFDAPYESASITNKKQYQQLIIDYRNQVLLEHIKASSYSKILVLYGEGHRKDFKQKIKAVKS